MPHPVQKLAERVTEQQEREAIAAAERKRVIAKTPEVLAAFAYGIDRMNPAPTPRK
jgi:hypothetical protein